VMPLNTHVPRGAPGNCALLVAEKLRLHRPYVPVLDPTDGGATVSAYDQAKVWTVPTSPSKSTAPPAPRARESRTRQKIAERWSRPTERTTRRFVWTEEYSVWARFAVVTTLAAAILWWPYGRSCGFGLALYLAATVMIIVGGVWVVACTWILRMARTHALAMLITLWGAALIVAQVLPRVGYAANAATWLCGPG
jgi:hypothetical protein